jgi:hypothetical protein
LPEVLDWIELGAFRRQGNDGDIDWNDQSSGQMPSGLIDQKDGVGSWCDGFSDFRQMQVHRLGIAGRQDQGCALALSGTDGAEDIG